MGLFNQSDSSSTFNTYRVRATDDLNQFGTRLFWLLVEAKKMSAGLARQDFAAMKILPGAKRRCGDFLAQTRRARPCLLQRFIFADTKAK